MREIRTQKTSGYKDFEVYALTRIIVPDKLPVKVTIGAERIVIPVGECMVVPAYLPIAINTSAERDEIVFDQDKVLTEGKFDLAKPIISSPFLIKSKDYSLEKSEKFFGFIKPLMKSDITKEENTKRLSPMEVVKGIISNSNNNDYYQEVRSKTLIWVLFSLIGDMLVRYNQMEDKPEVLDKLCGAIAYVDKYFGEAIELQSIANAVDYNKNHLSHFFKEFYNLPLYDYLLKKRSKEAAKLILETDMPAEQVMKATGFNSSSTFNRVFKNEMGCSPRDYKRLEIYK